MLEEIPVKVMRLRSGRWPLPEPATALSAGVDLRADLDEPLELHPGQTVAVPTGIAIALPEGWEAQVRPRSGLALQRSLGMLNAPGTIDADYRGEIKVLLTNFSQRSCTINPGERIAQLILARVCHPRWIEVDSLPESERGTGGFGHSGQ
ncbi:MAG TPA: dUTP diphosphatase [Bacteroidetes bacterium]|nr:dUTP diphosphatase [Bacteroidota bacterium]